MAGTVSVGGLMSGLDTNNIIEQLMAVETRQITQIEDRILLAEQRKIAVEYVTTQSISLSLSAYNLTKSRTFETKNAISSNEDILTSSTSYSAATGNYTFTVGQLAQSGQTVSAGFVNSDETAVGEGTLSIDRGDRSLKKPTLLESLNGGSGVAPGSILVTDRDGNSKTVNLNTAVTVNDIIERINNTSGISVTASLDSTSERLVLTDSSGGSGQLKVEEVSGGSTAADLGILSSVVADTLTGTDIVYITEDTRLEYINDGLGAVFNDSGTDDITIHDSTGSDFTDFNVDLSGAVTIGDVIDKINAVGTPLGVTASVSEGGNRIEFSDAGATAVSLGNSNAAEALGITKDGDVAIAQINTVLLRNLNGASGVNANSIDITDRSGATATIDLSSANTILDVINTINGTGGVDVTASVNDEENGILIEDNTGVTTSNLIIAENGGTTAEDLGIKTTAGGVSENSVSGLHTNLKIIGHNTKLDTLNAGQGVPSGKFKITLSDGTSQTVDITDTDIDTVGEVIEAIEGKFAPSKLTVRINDNGDGIYLEDLTSGASTFKVTEVNNGTTANALNILASGDSGVIDGSYKHTIDIDANDTLEDVARAINNANMGVTASIMNDGSSVTPYRLVLSSDNSGRLSRILVDTVNAAGDDDIDGFSFSETTRAKDAAVLIGSSGSDSSPILLTSNENQLENAISGLTLDLKTADPDTQVNVTVSRDIDGIEEAVEDFIEKFNLVMDTIDELTDYSGGDEDDNDDSSDSDESEEDSQDFVTGLLMGNSTLRRIQDALYEMITSNVNGNSGSYSTFRSVGIKLGSKGRLSLDASEFRTAINSDFESVFNLFAESRNIASSDNGGWANMGGGISAESGFDLQDLLNGNDDPDDYNDAGGGNGFKTEHVSGGYINFNFGQVKTINKLRLFHIDNNTFAAEDYALKSFNFEYLNPRTNTYETLLDVSNNTNPKTTYTLPEPVKTSSIRLKMYKTNDTSSPAYDRLVEFEAYENTGLASKLNNILKEYTSADGLLISEKDELDGKISDFNDQIEDLQDRAEMTREQLLSDFSEMEQALAEMQSQSNIFLTQMASMMG